MRTREISVGDIRVGMVIVDHVNTDHPKQTRVNRISRCTHSGKGMGKVHINETRTRRGEVNYGLCYELIASVTILDGPA